MIRPDLVVAKRGYYQGAQLGGAPSDHPEQFKGGLVGPLHVLEDRNPGAPLRPQQAEKRGKDPVAVGVGQRRPQLSADLFGDVEDRCQRPGRHCRVTRSPQHPA